MADETAWAFDPDAWGASPNREPETDRSVYDDDTFGDEELVPLARSLVTADALDDDEPAHSLVTTDTLDDEEPVPLARSR